VLERCGRDCVNVLFVGGVKPNKGHARALRAFAKYHRCGNPHSRLIFAGGLDERLKVYGLELRQLVSDLDLEGAVVFTGGITASELKSYYVSAAVFLCASEHEGFCVPLIESMYFRVPIVAAAAGAVPETLGDCGLLLDDWDEAKAASAIAAIVEDQDLAIDLGNRGRRRYLRLFQESVLRKQACQAIDEIRTALPKERGGVPAR
jgi:glycosyltransferase involved in cell wall biosynthesis